MRVDERSYKFKKKRGSSGEYGRVARLRKAVFWSMHQVGPTIERWSKPSIKKATKQLVIPAIQHWWVHRSSGTHIDQPHCGAHVLQGIKPVKLGVSFIWWRLTRDGWGECKGHTPPPREGDPTTASINHGPLQLAIPTIKFLMIIIIRPGGTHKISHWGPQVGQKPTGHGIDKNGGCNKGGFGDWSWYYWS